MTDTSQISDLKPLFFRQSILYFIVPGFLARLSIYPGQKWLLDQGVEPVYAFFISFGLPLAALFGWSFLLLWQEGVPFNRLALASRLQLKRISWRDLGWLILLLTITFLLALLLTPTAPWLVSEFPILAPPEWFPTILDPAVPQTQRGFAAFEWLGDVRGRWGIVIGAVLVYFFNIFGEELLWRGVLWPRQKLVHGRWTWLVHGLLWYAFHLPIYPWYLIFGLAATVPFGFLMQRTENTWLPIIMHTLTNFGTMVLFFIAVLGR